MQRTRVRRVAALAIGLSLVAAACGGDDDDARARRHGSRWERPAAPKARRLTEGTEAPRGPKLPTRQRADEEHRSARRDRRPTRAQSQRQRERSRPHPRCTGESDGTLNFATVLPETGNLAFLGPPEFAGAELAVNDINAAGGVLGQDVTLDQGDSGDTSTDIANQTVDRQLAAGADVFIGAASSGVSFTFIDKLVENCKIHFSPANTSPDFTDVRRRRPVLPYRSVRRAAGPGARRPHDRGRRHQRNVHRAPGPLR